MQVKISKLRNSLGLRLPRSLAQQIGVSEGQKVNVTAEGAKIIVQAAKPALRLEDLLTNMTPQAMAEAFSWGDGESGVRGTIPLIRPTP